MALQLDDAAEIAFAAAATMDSNDSSLLETWGGPFNGQQRRRELFVSLITALHATAIVETGSFRGSSTQFMASNSGLPLFSCEINPRFFFYSHARLKPFANATLLREDSRAFLRDLFTRKQLPAGTIFFYLDAHWTEDLPLWDELNLIFSSGVPSVVMIDDFRVPGDSGYTYDDYGTGKCLCVHDLRKSVVADVTLFFPRMSSAAETGQKRGSLIVASGDVAKQIHDEVGLVERLDWRSAIMLDAATMEHVPHEAVARYEREVSQLQSGVARYPTDRKFEQHAGGFVRQLRQRQLYRRMRAVIASSDLFDRDWYLRTYADVARAGMDPVKHYIKYGAAEDRDPGPFFSTRGYLAANSDVDAVGVNPLFHYLQFGRKEGRRIRP